MTSDSRPAGRKPQQRINLGVTAAACAVFVAGMVGVAFAAVPLYRIFCQVTGYGGTTPARDAPRRPRRSTASSPSASTPISATGSAGASGRSSAR